MLGAVLSDPRVRKWDALLRDPCAAELASPCYSGSDAGYLVRTVDFNTPNFPVPTGTVGAATKLDAYYQYTPFNLSTGTGVVQTGAATGSALPNTSAAGFSNFISNSGGVVFRYRPVACCLKWIPDGAYSNRSGTVGMGYSTGQPLPAGLAVSSGIGSLLTRCQMRQTNGAGPHEVRWLPTAVDENFTDTTAAVNLGAGSVMLAFAGIDATYNTTTTASANGRIEVTTVWEWVPNAASSVNIAPQPPVGYTTQQVLSTIQDMGQYLFAGLRTASRIMNAAQPMLLTGGYGYTESSGPSMLRM